MEGSQTVCVRVMRSKEPSFAIVGELTNTRDIPPLPREATLDMAVPVGTGLCSSTSLGVLMAFFVVQFLRSYSLPRRIWVFWSISVYGFYCRFHGDGALCWRCPHFTTPPRPCNRPSRTICSNLAVLRAETFMTRFIQSVRLFLYLLCRAFCMPYVNRGSSCPPRVDV